MVRVKETGRKIAKSYIGMNYYAAKALNLKFPHREDTILVYSKLKPNEKRRTIKHERVERLLMKRKGLSYQSAHRKALKAEKKHSRRKA